MFGLDKLDNIDLTWIVYPLAILLTGVCILPSTNQMMIGWERNLIIGLTYTYYMVSFTLIPIGFVYLALKKVKLESKLSLLAVVGMIMIIIFTHSLIDYFLGGHSFSEFLSVGMDHWLFPIAFGLFYLCDMNKIPKKFWFFLLPFALFAFFMGNAILIGNSISNSNMFKVIGAPNFPFLFFGVNNWQELLALPSQRLLNGFTDGFLQEFLTFFTLFPIVIFYYLLKKKV